MATWATCCMGAGAGDEQPAAERLAGGSAGVATRQGGRRSAPAGRRAAATTRGGGGGAGGPGHTVAAAATTVPPSSSAQATAAKGSLHGHRRRREELGHSCFGDLVANHFGCLALVAGVVACHGDSDRRQPTTQPVPTHAKMEDRETELSLSQPSTADTNFAQATRRALWHMPDQRPKEGVATSSPRLGGAVQLATCVTQPDALVQL